MTDYMEKPKNVTWACRDGVRKDKIQMELRLGRDIPASELSFCLYTDNKRLSKENVGLV